MEDTGSPVPQIIRISSYIALEVVVIVDRCRRASSAQVHRHKHVKSKKRKARCQVCDALLPLHPASDT